jgi:hypothetical protein
LEILRDLLRGACIEVKEKLTGCRDSRTFHPVIIITHILDICNKSIFCATSGSISCSKNASVDAK